MAAAVGGRASQVSRAPPPSPIATGRGIRSAADPILTDYLENSLRVPDLSIPEPLRFPPKVSLASLLAGDETSLRRMTTSAAKIGAFLIDGGDFLGGEEMRSAIEVGRGIFEMGEKMKRMMGERFGRGDGGEEEFYWSRNIEAETWPEEDKYRIFREKMRSVATRLEMVAESVSRILAENVGEHSQFRNPHKTQSILCLRKYDNSDHLKTGSSTKCHQPHILSLLAGDCHKLCLRSQEASYSFALPTGFILVVIGKPFQEWCDGEVKSYTGEIIPEGNNDQLAPVLLEFMFSPPFLCQEADHTTKTISILDQLLVILALALLYNLLG